MCLEPCACLKLLQIKFILPNISPYRNRTNHEHDITSFSLFLFCFCKVQCDSVKVGLRIIAELTRGGDGAEISRQIHPHTGENVVVLTVRLHPSGDVS